MSEGPKGPSTLYAATPCPLGTGSSNLPISQSVQSEYVWATRFAREQGDFTVQLPADMEDHRWAAV